VMGLLFYVSMLAAGVAAFFLPNSLLFLVIKLATGLALLVSLFLLWVQLYKVKDYCFYCIISALINVLLFLNGFFL